MPFLFLLLLHHLLLRLSSAAVPHQQPHSSQTTTPPPFITQACKATRFQPLCETSLTHQTTLEPLPRQPTALDVVRSSLSLSSSAVRSSLPIITSLLRSASGDLNLSSHSKNCLYSHLPLSLHRLALASSTLSPQKDAGLRDARAYGSASLQYTYDCWSELSYSNTTSRVDRAMSFLDSVIRLTSNSLSMIASYDVFGPDPRSWRPPLTERAGFWEPVRGLKYPYKPTRIHDELELGRYAGSGLGRDPRTVLVPRGMVADATVCKGGRREGCYVTVQEAVNAAPNSDISGKSVKGRRFVISIKGGVYKEIVRVPLEKRNVVFFGDGMGKTVITGDLSVARPGLFTYNTATVGMLHRS